VPAAANGFDGITVCAGSSVHHCSAVDNGSRGKHASGGGCYVTGNTANGNNNGIYIENRPNELGSRLEANVCCSNGSYAFIVNGTRNLVVRNSASGNGHALTITSGNVFGPVPRLTAGGSVPLRPHGQHRSLTGGAPHFQLRLAMKMIGRVNP
jgi:hypothetical protein